MNKNQRKERDTGKGSDAEAMRRMVAFALALVGAALVVASVLNQRIAIERDAAEYDRMADQLRMTQMAEMPEQAFPDKQAETGYPEQDVPPVLQEQPAGPSAETVTPAMAEPAYQTGADLAACQARNDDFIGWIQIPDTNVDYPIVWTDDPEYDLHHTFTGRASGVGTIFSLIQTDYAKPSQNIAIYGHHLGA